MMLEADVYMQQAECMVHRQHIGYTEYLNICTTRSVNVDWSLVQWMGFAGLVIFLAFILLVGIGICVEIKENW